MPSKIKYWLDISCLAISIVQTITDGGNGDGGGGGDGAHGVDYVVTLRSSYHFDDHKNH